MNGDLHRMKKKRFGHPYCISRNYYYLSDTLVNLPFALNTHLPITNTSLLYKQRITFAMTIKFCKFFKLRLGRG